jgi:hypothetical protein
MPAFFSCLGIGTATAYAGFLGELPYKLKDDRLMEDNKISQFIQALKFFDLELEEITGQPGYEGKNKVIAIRKKGGNSRILCAYSTYDELLEWASQQFKD